MSPTKILTTMMVLATLASTELTAQCRTPLPFTTCTGTEPLVIADEIITQGITKWYYGSTVTMNSLTLRGGTLIVCGDLTIDKFYMDSGQIIVNPSARFVIGSGIGSGLMLQGNCSISNYGTLECYRNLSLENGWASAAKPNVVINATVASVFKMPNQYFVINNANSWFVNNGTAQFWGLIVDAQASPGSVCLNTSRMQMAILINKVANAYRVNSGNACVYVHQLSQFFGVLTSSPNLFACMAASHTSDAGCIPFGCQPNNWGAAQLFTSCNTCASLDVLPLRTGVTSVSRSSDPVVKIYPSPFTTDFFIELPGNDKIEKIIVSDLSGKSIAARYQQTGHQWRVTLIHHLSKQALIVQIVTGNSIIVRKIMKE
jgi:hypothetical protein